MCGVCVLCMCVCTCVCDMYACEMCIVMCVYSFGGWKLVSEIFHCTHWLIHPDSKFTSPASLLAELFWKFLSLSLEIKITSRPPYPPSIYVGFWGSKSYLCGKHLSQPTFVCHCLCLLPRQLQHLLPSVLLIPPSSSFGIKHNFDHDLLYKLLQWLPIDRRLSQKELHNPVQSHPYLMSIRNKGAGRWLIP